MFDVLLLLVFCAAPLAAAEKKERPARFLPEEREIIKTYYSSGNTKGLPPGLAKRGGDLPPGLQKQLQRNGTLPPGLQKRIEPLPADLERRLPPVHENYQRVVLGPRVLLLDRRTSRILDIIDDVVGLIRDR